MKRLAAIILATVSIFQATAQDSIQAAAKETVATESYATERISRLEQTESDTSKEQKVKVMDGHIEYSSHNSSATVTGSNGETVTIYNLSGKAVLEQAIESDSQEISLSGLGKGVFLLRLGSKTAKIVL